MHRGALGGNPLQREGLTALLSPWIFCISIQKEGGELHTGTPLFSSAFKLHGAKGSFGTDGAGELSQVQVQCFLLFLRKKPTGSISLLHQPRTKIPVQPLKKPPNPAPADKKGGGVHSATKRGK